MNDAVRQFAAPDGIYVNSVTDFDDDDPVAAAYGAKFARLVEVKTKYDPTNLFRHSNADIAPARS